MDEPKPIPAPLPSIDDARPAEEGGPNARKGFNYQDEIAAGFLIEMLENNALLQIDCETHDDLVLRWSDEPLEYVQVKADDTGQYWSVAELCHRKSGAGSSLFESSLGRDRFQEEGKFRIVTLRPVTAALRPLTFERGGDARALTEEAMVNLRGDIDTRCPGALSAKGFCREHWLENCVWSVRHSEEVVRNDNRRRLLELATAAGQALLIEQIDALLDELRVWVKDAGARSWIPDKSLKVISKTRVVQWWATRLADLADTRHRASGGKLAEKLTAAGLPSELIELAAEMRRDYSATVRTPRYMEPERIHDLQNQVKSLAMILRSRLVADEIDDDGPSFHMRCLEGLAAIGDSTPDGAADEGAFLQGCLYDIADRCLLRFDRPAP